jgi:CoA:oxalate CoA-transferase
LSFAWTLRRNGRLCRAIERSDLIGHPFSRTGARARHHAELEPPLISALSKRTRAEWLSILEAAEVPAGPINDIPAMVRDAQVAARGMIRRVGACAFVGQPIQFSGYPELPEEPAPMLGEHTEAVLAECGYSMEEISAMKAEGAI